MCEFRLAEQTWSPISNNMINSVISLPSPLTVWMSAFPCAYRLLLPGLIISALMTITDYMVLFFSCHGLKIYGAWLHKYQNTDLWLIRILVKWAFFVFSVCGLWNGCFSFRFPIGFKENDIKKKGKLDFDLQRVYVKACKNSNKFIDSAHKVLFGLKGCT